MNFWDELQKKFIPWNIPRYEIFVRYSRTHQFFDQISVSHSGWVHKLCKLNSNIITCLVKLKKIIKVGPFLSNFYSLWHVFKFLTALTRLRSKKLLWWLNNSLCPPHIVIFHLNAPWELLTGDLYYFIFTLPGNYFLGICLSFVSWWWQLSQWLH